MSEEPEEKGEGDQPGEPEMPEDPDTRDDAVDLTPEQRAQLKASMEALRRSLAPKIDLSGLTRLTQMRGDFLKLRPISTGALAPFLAGRDRWSRQVAAINSDFFKSHAATQSQFAKLSTQLTRNVDFGLGASISKITRDFAAQQASFLKDIGPILAGLKSAFYPLNLRGIEGLKFEDVEKVVMVDGIALYGVPRTSTAEALIRADDAARRRAILGNKWRSISADCRAAVSACDSDAVTAYLPFALTALDALDAGHERAAQALAGSIIDTLVRGYFGADRFNYTPSRRTRTNAAYEEFPVREFIAMAPIWQAYQQFDAARGDPIPTTFSRHATAHTMSPKQYSRRNAIQGLLLASSLIHFFNEQSAARAGLPRTVK